MSVKHGTRPAWGFWLALALWAGVFTYSLWVYQTTPPLGDGFARGLNRVSGFLGWQVLAALLAFAVFRAGRGLPAGTALARIRLCPMALALLMVAGLVTLTLWSQLRGMG